MIICVFFVIYLFGMEPLDIGFPIPVQGKTNENLNSTVGQYLIGSQQFDDWSIVIVEFKVHIPFD
jgi:hypothetical protein